MNCSFCGREVHSTRHYPSAHDGYRVDAYRLLAGDCELVTIQNPRHESETLTFYKVTQPRPMISCAECQTQPEVAEKLDQLFHELPKPTE